MKLAFVNQPYDRVLPPRQNSIGLIAYKTAVEMAHKADVTMYGRRHPDDDPRGLPFDVRFITAPWDDRLHGMIGRYPRWARRLRIEHMSDTHTDYARRVAADFSSTQPDVVHVMNYWSWCRTLQRSRGRHKIVLEMQCEWLSQKPPEQVQRQLEAVDAVVGVSDHITSLFTRAFPNYSGIVATAYNGVDTHIFTPRTQPKADDETQRILFVGRVSPEKGVHTLIDAFAIIADRVPNATLDIVGAKSSLPSGLLVDLSDDPMVLALKRFYDGSLAPDYQTYLQQLVAKYGLQNRIRFPGALPHADLVASYQNADLVVNPSLSESFGIAIVEGMSSGVPVVATRVGGMLETVVDGETGYLVEPEQPEALAAAMEKALTNQPIRQHMIQAGRARAVERFSWKARADRMNSVYTRLA